MEMKHLKEKVDAGADFVMSQIFYDVCAFVTWRDACVTAGISCPIIPGVLPFQSFSFLSKMISQIKCHVPEAVMSSLEAARYDDARIKQLGVRLCVNMCRQLLAAGVPGLHLYSLNLEKSISTILEGLGLATTLQGGSLPWLMSRVPDRKDESVRPIYWANRPHSYLDRTSSWDEFPNGRWGDSSSPAFHATAAHHLVSFRLGTVEERQNIWGQTLTQPSQVFSVFAGYLAGTVPRLPWCESAIQLETDPIKDILMRLNQAGFLTINSQPRVNGASSSDPSVGWGGPGGYVYQKAYLEFFTSYSNLTKLAEAARANPNISYDAADAKGTVVRSQPFGADNVNALTWGVFPNKEIIQPTVADHAAFLIWKDEAFALWDSHWKCIYPPNSPSAQIITQIQSTYFLVTVVDNDFVRGDLFTFMEQLI
jgi:methylenetetrahydrofolate reductase (NADPH)